VYDKAKKKPRQRGRQNVGIQKSLTPTWNTTLKFQSVPANAGTLNLFIGVGNLQQCVVVAKTATTSSVLFAMLRLKGIRINVAAISTLNNNASCTLQMQDTGTNDVTPNLTFSVGPQMTQVKKIAYYPSGNDTWRKWKSTNDTTTFSLFTIEATVYIEIDIEYRAIMAQTVPAGAIVAGTPGAIYFRGLDSQLLASSKLPPVDTNDAI
jgi:hypothetical protein